jgi:hypothetical protein
VAFGLAEGAQDRNWRGVNDMVTRKVINPWTWGDAYGFVQAVESLGGRV